jgi:hypothetical protein
VSVAQRAELELSWGVCGGGFADRSLLGDLSLFQSAVPFLILVALMERNLIVTYVVAVAAGVSVAAAFLLPW